MENRPYSREARLKRYSEAFGKRIKNFEEMVIHDGVGISSLFNFEGLGQVYSKSFLPELYGKKSKNGETDHLSVSEIYDGKEKIGLDEYESKVTDTLYNLSLSVGKTLKAEGHKGEMQNELMQVAPRLYGRVPEEKRFFTECLMSSTHWPTLRDRLIEIDNEIHRYDTILKLETGVSNDLLITLNKLKDKKSMITGDGMFYLAYLHHLCSSNMEKFGEIKHRKRAEEIERQCEYFERTIFDHYRDKEFKDIEQFRTYLKKEKKLDIREKIQTFRDYKRKLFSQEGDSLINRATPIHGDCGAQHMTVDGIFFDFDEFRKDLPQDDIVRFLNSEFVSALTPHKETEIISRLEDYFIDRKRLNGEIKWGEKFSKKKEDIIRPFMPEFQRFVQMYYCERLDENIHIYAINKKFESGESHRLESLSEGHPTMKTAEDFKTYRINDINKVLSFLLGTEGRERVLQDISGDKSITRYFEEMRRFLEISGISNGLEEK